VRLTTLPPTCAVVMKSGNHNFLERSGPLQACNGTVLPLPFTCVANTMTDRLVKLGNNLASALPLREVEVSTI